MHCLTSKVGAPPPSINLMTSYTSAVLPTFSVLGVVFVSILRRGRHGVDKRIAVEASCRPSACSRREVDYRTHGGCALRLFILGENDVWLNRS